MAHSQARFYLKRPYPCLSARAGDSPIGEWTDGGKLDISPQLVCHPRMPAKQAPIKDKYSKTQIIDQIAASTELSRKQVAAVLDSLTDVIEAHVKKNAVGEFVLPGLFKISTVRKPATKARKGINPFTKEEVMFKAKPASTVVKVRPLKKLALQQNLWVNSGSGRSPRV